jgi:hypothetical protein
MKKHPSLILTALLMVSMFIASCGKDPVEPDPQSGTFELAFAVKWGTNDLIRSEKYAAPDGRNYQIDVLKFYISRLKLVTQNDSVVNLADVALFDLYKPASQVVASPAPVGNYKTLRFNLGLDYDLNHSDQTNYATTHPMSTTTGMYWTWATQYIFSMVEGRADTTGGQIEDIFLYHSGQDSLLRTMEFNNLNLSIVADGTKRHTLTVDLQKVFFGANDTIDVKVDPNTHTTDNPGLASRITNQLMHAIQ